jgi:peptidase S41-like protein
METGMNIAHLLAAAAGAVACGTCLAQPVPAPAEIADSPVTAREARRTALSLAGILEEAYVFPDVARRYAAALRAKAGSGVYDDIGTAPALAERLTADVQAVAPDNHLRVLVGPPGPPGAGPRRIVVRGSGGPGAPVGPRIVVGGGPPGPGAPQPQAIRMAPPPPIEEARWLAPGIAFVRFNLFPGDSATAQAAARFMAGHAEAKTIIFDIRTHRGGGLAEMDAILPYLFARPATLVTMDTRASVDRAGGNPIGDGLALRPVPAGSEVVRREHFVTPHASEKRMFDARVYLLTSAFSGSAAEHFALAMKRTHRASLIGETTAGAGNYGGVRAVGDRFSVFVPVGRTFDPDTGKGWEGTGVAPDIAVPAERALVEALTRSGVAQAEAERLSAEVAPKGPMARIVPRRP